MSEIGFILDRLTALEDRPALFWRGQAFDGTWMAGQVRRDIQRLTEQGLAENTVVILRGDYSPWSVSLLLALIEMKAILAPLLPSTLNKTPGLVDIVNPALQIDSGPDGEYSAIWREQSEPHALIRKLQDAGKPGLILFTSGSTGEPKGVVHDLSRLLVKFQTPRPAMRTLNFLLFDHWGGLNTLLHTLSPMAAPWCCRSIVPRITSANCWSFIKSNCCRLRRRSSTCCC